MPSTSTAPASRSRSDSLGGTVVTLADGRQVRFRGAADRVDVAEHVVRSFASLRPDNPGPGRVRHLARRACAA